MRRVNSRFGQLLGVMLAATMLQGCQSLNVLAAIDGPYVPPGERSAQPETPGVTTKDMTTPAAAVIPAPEPVPSSAPDLAAPEIPVREIPAPVIAEPAIPAPARSAPVIVLTLDDADPALARSILAREEAAQLAPDPEPEQEIALIPEPEPEPEPAAAPAIAIAAVVREPVTEEADAARIGPPPPDNPRENEFASAFDFIADDSDETVRTEREGVKLAEPPAERLVEPEPLPEPALAATQLARAEMADLPTAAPEIVEAEPVQVALTPAVAAELAEPAEPVPAPPQAAITRAPSPQPSSQLEREAAALGLTVLSSMPAPTRSPFDLAPGTGSEAYQPFFDHVMAQLTAQPSGGRRESMLLLDPPSLDPALQICGNRPPAVLIDLDPANGLMPLVGQNRPQGTLAAQLATLRQRGVTIYWISGHGPGQASAIRRRLADSGLDPDGVDPLIVTRFAGESKQERRYGLGDSNCLLAIMGDQRADFDELYDFVLDPIMAAPLEGLIGEGWFLAPPPLD